MVVEEVVAACGGDSLELVVGKSGAEVTARCGEGIQETVAGIVKAICVEDRFEAAFIEAGIVSHEGHIRETIGFKGGKDTIFDFVPYVREERSVFRIVGTQAVNLLAEPGVVVRIGMDEAVEGVHHFPIAHDDYAHRTHAGWASVGSFKVDGYEGLPCHFG